MLLPNEASTYDDYRVYAGTSADVPLPRFEVFTGTGRRRDWGEQGSADRLCLVYKSGDEDHQIACRRFSMRPARPHRLVEPI